MNLKVKKIIYVILFGMKFFYKKKKIYFILPRKF